MDDLVKSISTIKNFMGNAGRNTCNDYLYEELLKMQLNAWSLEYLRTVILGLLKKTRGLVE